MFCNCSPNVQLADSKNIFTCLTLYSFFNLRTEVKNYILLREDAGKFMCVYICSLNVQCVNVWSTTQYGDDIKAMTF